MDKITSFLRSSIRAAVQLAHHLGLDFEKIEVVCAEVIADVKADVVAEAKKLEVGG